MIRSEVRMNLPANVQQIINVLTEHGFEAYAVGGCVRDSILHKEPKDWDITTSAKPEEVKACFRRTIDTGIQHGTVTVMMGEEGYEITTYRIDGEYADGRHPDSVEFSDNLVEDLKRRDFTINAMAYNETFGVVDEFGGIEDLQEGIIRCVRNAKERFNEDALRMMRAVRFSAQLGFQIEEKTFAAIKELAPNISKVSKERIQVEFSKTILSKHPEYLQLYETSGIMQYILPYVREVLLSEERKKVLTWLQNSDEELSVRYAVLLCLVGSKKAEEELRGLKLDNVTITQCKKLIEALNYPIPETKIQMRQFLCKTGKEFWLTYSRFRKTYIKAFQERHENFEKMEHADSMYEEILEKKECTSLKELEITGNDLILLGIKPGKQMGEILQKMLELVLEEPDRNKREQLENYLTQILEK